MDVLFENDVVETFEKLLDDVEQAVDQDDLTFFQTIHAKGIATRTRDWITSVSEKLHQEYLSSIALRKVIVDQWMGHYAEKKAILASQRESPGAGNEAIYALTQRMVELHNRSVANERNLVRNVKLFKLARVANNNDVSRAERFIQEMNTISTKLSHSRFCDPNSNDQPTEMVRGVLPNARFQRLMSDNFGLRSKETLLEAQREGREVQSGFLPGRNTTKLFKSIWPCAQKQAPVDQAITHPNSPQNPTSKFPRFLSLPPEIRRLIWKAALPDGRIALKKKWVVKRKPVPGQWTSEEPCYRLALQLVCRESYKVMNESYTLALELKTDGTGEHNLETLCCLSGIYINPDKDIVPRWRLPGEYEGNSHNLSISQYWDRKLFGLTRVKHLALEIFDFDDMFGQFHCVDKTKKEALDRIEASCPNLESLTITWNDDRYVRKYLGDDSIQGPDYKLFDIDSDFIDRMAATPGNDQDTRDTIRMDQIIWGLWYQEYIQIFNDMKESGSEYWNRMEMRMVFFVKPIQAGYQRYI